MMVVPVKRVYALLSKYSGELRMGGTLLKVMHNLELVFLSC